MTTRHKQRRHEWFCAKCLLCLLPWVQVQMELKHSAWKVSSGMSSQFVTQYGGIIKIPLQVLEKDPYTWLQGVVMGSQCNIHNFVRCRNKIRKLELSYEIQNCGCTIGSRYHILILFFIKKRRHQLGLVQALGLNLPVFWTPWCCFA